ncbi:Putative glycosyltransferase EpsE [Acaryochloris thomasi RCC1774]|uniref:Glycosyltransferase EpsE n=2 Tax=Acaryochloris TaxID=155977 RepID=A0A2W1JX43_9CYAN|nr:Putative glycosyltransferase EpsE [Acaryochloris thomasi RCC1774]
MSVYNGELFLEQSMESILSQTYANFELILIDDCSTDNTIQILEHYAQRDWRIRLFRNKENIGLTKSLNKGLELAKGEYVARQDADDISLPERFETQVTFLDNHPEIGLVSCNMEIINFEGHKTGEHKRACSSEFVSWYLLFYNRLAGHSQVTFRRQLITKLGGYDEQRRFSQDYELWSRVAKVSKIAILSETLLKQRIHNSSVSTTRSSEQRSYSLSQSKHNIEELISKEINLEEVVLLRNFWLSCWPLISSLEIRESIYNLNSRLIDIYQSFTQQSSQRGDDVKAELSQCLRILIGKQFLAWVQFPMKADHTLFPKLWISYYAFFWCPQGVPISWLILLWRTLPKWLKLPVRKGYRISRNLFKVKT